MSEVVETADGGVQPVAAESPLGPLGPWFSESVRLTVSRAGHFLPMILFFVLLVSLLNAYAIWYAVRDTVITVDNEAGTADFSFGGSPGWLAVSAACFPISVVLSFVVKGAAIRQAVTTKAERPEPWSESIRAVFSRGGRILGYSLLRTVVYWAGLALVLVATALSPAGILLLPVVVPALIYLWLRLAFVGTVATVGERQAKPFAESWRMTAPHQLPLFGRLLLLAVLAFNLILAAGIIGSPLTALAGGASGTAPIGPTADVIRFNDLMGSNPSVFALGSVFNALGLGANYVLAAVGTTLLYAKLGGTVSADVSDPSNDWRDAE
jgi:hypothetical protein